MNKKYVFRYNNLEDYLQPKGTYERIIQWCGMYEIPIKYIGKSLKRRCKWLEITVDAFTANMALMNDPVWKLHKVIE